MYKVGETPLFPVVFFDGEREMYIGDINIDPTLEYKPFQLMIGHKIGVSPNQISIYLVDRRKYARTPFSEEHRRIPITGKVNFGLICRQTDCCFLVVLKRTRKSKNRRIANVTSFDSYPTVDEFSTPPMILKNPGLLRRNNSLDMVAQSELNPSVDRLRRLSIRREIYERAMLDATLNMHNFNSRQSIVPISQAENRPVIVENDGTVALFCAGCEDSEMEHSTTSFHPCVNDRLIQDFRPIWGPIRRPNKHVL